jgi:hypothetical protein
MNSKLKSLAAGFACAIATVAVARADMAPQAKEVQVSGPAPSQSQVWMSGHWNSEAGQWKWVAAHWEQPPSRSALWISGHWASNAGGWTWVNGAWNVTETSQSQEAPPQPPTAGASQPLQSEPSVIGSGMPSTPAPSPYVDGEDGPGEVSRTVDDGAVVTEYGPTGYYYPGYATWAGYPWFWDGAFVGFGFGGHYNHGGYFRGRGYGGRGYGGGHFGRGASAAHFSGHTH